MARALFSAGRSEIELVFDLELGTVAKPLLRR
jgi:hypothetical protein